MHWVDSIVGVSKLRPAGQILRAMPLHLALEVISSGRKDILSIMKNNIYKILIYLVECNISRNKVEIADTEEKLLKSKLEYGGKIT